MFDLVYILFSMGVAFIAFISGGAFYKFVPKNIFSRRKKVKKPCDDDNEEMEDVQEKDRMEDVLFDERIKLVAEKEKLAQEVQALRRENSIFKTPEFVENLKNSLLSSLGKGTEKVEHAVLEEVVTTTLLPRIAKVEAEREFFEQELDLKNWIK